jgi:putative DNA primase/helicase
LKYRDIKNIFENYRIGEKYREHSSPDGYLRHNINKAKEFTNLTKEERLDPLFISGALHKDDKNKYHLKVVPFQEYMNKKHKLKFLEKERAFFLYNGKCYEQCTDDRLNNLCQTELGKHRTMFGPAAKNNFIHFAIGRDLVEAENAYEDQVRYLTMQNGLYDLIKHRLIEHDADIFTTNLLPYNFDQTTDCSRWLQYLDEVFLSDKSKIRFIQEAVGYMFQKSIPQPALFFMIGDGCNGKSVFIDVISSLCGKENVCNISLKRLCDEKYLPELFGKLINVSAETPRVKSMNTDMIKAVVAGDWVTGREVYKRPTKFKPYAKHYLSMNTLPTIEDNTHGMWRRINVIEFPRRFSEEEMDVELTDKLMNELSGIFNWALEGFKRLKNRRFIFSNSQSIKQSKREYKQDSNSALDFLKNYMIDDSKESVPLKDAYALYEQFCKAGGIYNILTKPEFSKFFRSEGYKVDNSKKHSNQVHIFGLKM